MHASQDLINQRALLGKLVYLLVYLVRPHDPFNVASRQVSRSSHGPAALLKSNKSSSSDPSTQWLSNRFSSTLLTKGPRALPPYTEAMMVMRQDKLRTPTMETS